MNKIPYLHVYGNEYGHADSFIIGNAESLRLLRDTIDYALANGIGSFPAFVADGEGYNVKILVEEEDSFWEKSLRPYLGIDEDTRPDAIGPSEAFRRRLVVRPE
jgi:hypothetical protein